MKPTVAIVGGFLGAGKTTLILRAARALAARGVRVAVVMNDQGADLVDAELARRHGVDADQVSGGCFCCRFPDLVDALARLDEHGAQVIFAEAVGSCTDIVATTLRPLLRDHCHRFRIAPLTVLVHGKPEGPDLEFLFDHQVAEADLVIDRDADLDWWLAELLREGVTAGARPIAVDYARYAQAEAALGWLNARVRVVTRPALSPAMVVGPLLDGLDEDLTALGIRIVHLKVLDQCATGYVKAALTGNGLEPGVEGMLDASPARVHEVLINLRALGDPGELREIVEAAFAAHRAEWLGVASFRPSPPVPFHFDSNRADTAPAGSSITQ
jgi:CobW/HypB/UreG, nucleotide-binding domain